MKVINIPNFQCEYCEKIFKDAFMCELHEREQHLCPNCKSSYYSYGCELNCVRKNKNKPCFFEKKS